MMNGVQNRGESGNDASARRRFNSPSAKNGAVIDLEPRLRRKYRYEALHCLILDDYQGLGEYSKTFKTTYLFELRDRLRFILSDMGLEAGLLAQLVEDYRQRHDRDCHDSGRIAADHAGYDDVRLWDYLIERLYRPGDPFEPGNCLELCRRRGVEGAAMGQSKTLRDHVPEGCASRAVAGGDR